MINFGAVPAGSVLPVFFDSYAGSTGASVTISGLAVTDIEIYKGTSMTQRSSDAGYTLLDTDGIDIDGTTGIHGFSIDTSDNTDAGFYAAGSFYNVVVSAITVDSQTVNFVAATFRLVAAENTAGTPVADTVRVGGGSVPSGALPNAVAGAAGGVFIAGTNAATTVTTALTTTFTGNLTGSVGSVTGAVGSVTGAVGSVTGNVGGNVTGSVGSVVGAVGSVTGNVGGNVTGTVAGVTPATAAQVAALLTTQITEAYRANGAAPTLAQFMSEVLAHLGEASISGTTKTINSFDHTTPAETFTLDDATNPSSITRAT